MGAGRGAAGRELTGGAYARPPCHGCAHEAARTAWLDVGRAATQGRACPPCTSTSLRPRCCAAPGRAAGVSAEASPSRPRLGRWQWRPWYAALWAEGRPSRAEDVPRGRRARLVHGQPDRAAIGPGSGPGGGRAGWPRGAARRARVPLSVGPDASWPWAGRTARGQAELAEMGATVMAWLGMS